LRCNRIGNITGVAFENMPSLIEVNLGCNKVKEKGSCKKAESLNQQYILRSATLKPVPSKM
jgi:hypothetical protein